MNRNSTGMQGNHFNFFYAVSQRITGTYAAQEVSYTYLLRFIGVGHLFQ